ncbi:HlyD family efflux transporter periplasmic adaptor subunit [Salinarimonas sp. NSM]|uniref:HlyD family efflux transporter periplasmic adaptor subunit n=1 Tax=Salinarimonas sp. NSM TaxID=3458003 RepID=UPI004036E3CA
MLHEGPPGGDGAPTWTLEDPARARYFRIGWAEVEMLARWEAGDPAAIAAAVSQATTLALAPADVEAFARFLVSANLVQVRGPDANARLVEQKRAGRMGPLTAALKNYLFIRIPLVRPDAFLGATLPLARPFFGAVFRWLSIAAGVLGVALALRQWDAFLTTFVYLFSWQGALAVGLALVAAKLLHELGHAYAAKREGLPVPTMGVALMVLYPVLYTDTTAGWRLTDRRARLRIGYAGMAIELALASWMTLAWSFLPDGPVRSAAFVLATTTWIMTLAVNLNPFMRFDGYFLLSDLIDAPNLQDRAFRHARWRLREALFGFGEPPPEPLSRRRGRLFVAYAIGTWLYRFFLFLGIALLVYHLFFKLLGILLMVVELAWFIGRPIALEIAEWAKRREAYRLNRHTVATGLAAAGLVVLAIVPWSSAVNAPALFEAEERVQVHAPVGARLEVAAAAHGARVAAGDPLFGFVSPDMDYRLAEVERRIAVLRWRASVEIGAGVEGASRDVIFSELEGAVAERAALRRLAERLSVTAPIDGRVVELAEDARPGTWMPEGAWLATIAAPGTGEVAAYVREADLARIAPGAQATFHADAPGRAPVPLVVARISETATRRLDATPELASDHGGGIAANLRDGALVPHEAVYRVVLRPVESGAPEMALRGTVRLDGEAESFVARAWRAAVAVVVRESGF